MKKNFIFLLTLLLAVTQGAWATPSVAVDGKLPGAFSVSDTKKVYFSQGNLQYTKSTGKWKIMDHQYDMVETLSQNVGTDYADQDVVTLFGWGTSGWNNTAADATSVHYQPYSTCNTNHSTANNNYQYGPSLANVAASESWSKEVAGNHPYENYDWGVFNSGDLGAGWRTLTKDEWGYLFNTRTPGNSVNGVSNARYTEATINTDGTAVNGIILFPDDAVMTSVSGVTWGNINSSGTYGVVSPTSTQCTSAGWTALETAGCVFLPAAGYRSGSSVNYVGSYGYYWSSSASSATFAYLLYFYSGNMIPQFNFSRYYGCSVRLVSDEAPVPPAMTETPLTFEAMVAGAQIKFTGYNNPLTIQYSTDGTNWTNYTSAITLANVGDKVYLRGNNATYKYGNSYNGILECTKDCYIYGNIMSLVDATNYATATTLTGANTFQKIFYNNTHIKNHPDKDLVLPATTLTNYCYHSMFDGCTGLTRVPQLPATNVAIYCYQNMFKGCTGLTSIPENLLPAETLQNYCYNNMFQGCTGLTSIPENLLPATTLANQCYGSMFYGCTGLTSVPENLLPATTLAGSCYSSMFYGCTGLTSVPANLLPATTLANYCYYCMFYGCTGLTTAPALPATTLATYCYYYMFRNCTYLTSAPVLPATTLEEYCYYNMFMSCSHLSKVVCYATESAQYATTKWLDGVSAGGTFYAPSDGCFNELARGTSAIPVVWNIQDIMNATPLTFEAMVAGATVTYTLNDTKPIQYSTDGTTWTDYDGAITLATVGDKVSFRGNNDNYNSNSAKFNCSQNCYIYGNIMSLVDATNYATATTLSSDHAFYHMFAGNTRIKNHPSKDLVLPATTLSDYCYEGMFQGCTGLTSVPEDLLPATTLATRCYLSMFYNCSNLTNVPALPATTIAERCYAAMFQNCTNLTSAPALHATTLAGNCYESMFQGCTHLTSAPALPATTLAANCYKTMFKGCTGLTAAPMLPATTLANNCYSNMFQGCTGLTSAPELPATTMISNCYAHMFENCTGLTDAPVLSATNLATNCYIAMFQGCTGLTSAPVLPATTLANCCYQNMFYGCTGLTSAPELPATTLVSNCYYQMFYGCTGLTSAPELPATNLVNICYYQMFYGCSNLSSVTCLATSRSNTNATTEWLSGVAESGTFYGPKNSVFASEARSASGIPTGWNFSPFQASLTAAPTAVDNLVYNGSEQALLNNDGVAAGGTINYSLDNSTWSTSIPTATDADDYTVYYKVVGDASHTDYTPSPNTVAVTINKADAVITDTPAAVEGLVYTGAPLTLIQAGEATGGEMQYKVDASAWSTDLPTGTDASDYTVYYKVVGDGNHNGIDESSFNVTIAAPAAVIGDPNTADQITAFLNYYNGQNVAALTIERPVLNNMYNTLCLPFDMNAAQIAASSLNGVEIYELEEVTVANDELFLGLSDAVNAVVAGRPYIVKYSAASQLDDLDFENVTINNADLTAQAVTMNGVTFKGTFTPFVMGIQNGFDTNGGYLFLGQNDQLFWPNTNNPLKPFRAYFYIDLNSGSGNAPLRFGMPARIGRPASTPTGVENVQSDKVQSTKVIENGQLFILKNGVKYNAQGQMVK